MMGWFSRAKPAVEMPAISAFYCMKVDADPWGIRAGDVWVQVLDVKDGWVRYRRKDARADDVLPIDTFRGCYMKQPSR